MDIGIPPKSVIEMYRIIPTTQSMLGSMILVILLFIIYIIFIGWMAILDMKTTPNISMFLNFILDNHEKSIKQFQKYIISVLTDQDITPDDTSSTSTSTPSTSTSTSTSTPSSTSSPYTSKTTTKSPYLLSTSTSEPEPEPDTESFVNQNSGIIGKISKIFESGFQRFLLMIHLRGNKIFVNKTTY
jgi:hypothetical protein